ncbi:MAG: response regulator receiver protein [Hyphomicrobiales bacterium]|nr:response regulator receiver protein [Hyphomicrobiales bacterium]
MTVGKVPMVLVVEDEEIVREMVCMDLVDAGFSVREAATGDEAIRILQEESAGEEQIGVLFTDIRMPGSLDGWSLAERARVLKPQLQVLYASGYSAEPAREVPGSFFITKPYRTTLLLEMIRRLGIQ